MIDFWKWLKVTNPRVTGCLCGTILSCRLIHNACHFVLLCPFFHASVFSINKGTTKEHWHSGSPHNGKITSYSLCWRWWRKAEFVKSIDLFVYLSNYLPIYVSACLSLLWVTVVCFSLAEQQWRWVTCKCVARFSSYFLIYGAYIALHFESLHSTTFGF